MTSIKKYEKELLPPVNMEELKNWVKDRFGKKCNRYYPFCPTCYAWHLIEDLEILLKE